jgi:hypothetical protein
VHRRQNITPSRKSTSWSARCTAIVSGCFTSRLPILPLSDHIEKEYGPECGLNPLPWTPALQPFQPPWPQPRLQSMRFDHLQLLCSPSPTSSHPPSFHSNLTSSASPTTRRRPASITHQRSHEHIHDTAESTIAKASSLR